jgi:hypothetical protein
MKGPRGSLGQASRPTRGSRTPPAPGTVCRRPASAEPREAALADHERVEAEGERRGEPTNAPIEDVRESAGGAREGIVPKSRRHAVRAIGLLRGLLVRLVHLPWRELSCDMHQLPACPKVIERISIPQLLKSLLSAVLQEGWKVSGKSIDRHGTREHRSGRRDGAFREHR